MACWLSLNFVGQLHFGSLNHNITSVEIFRSSDFHGDSGLQNQNRGTDPSVQTCMVR